MRKFADIPIQQKLMAIIMGTTAVALMVAGILLVISESILLRGDLRQDLLALSRIVADNSTGALSFDDAAAATETLGALRARERMLSACVYRADGSVLARYRRGDVPLACPPPAALDRIHFSGGLVSVSRAVLLQAKRIGTLSLLYDAALITDRLRIYGLTVAAVLLGTALVVFLISSRLSRVVSIPLSQLARTATSVSHTRDFRIRAEKHSNDELGVLVDEFNEMLARIESRENELRQALLDREEALRRAQSARDYLRTTLASIGDAVLSTDSQGRVVFLNPVAQSMLRSTEPEVIGRPVGDVFRIVGELTREPLEGSTDRVLREGSAVQMTDHAILIAVDGTETPIEETAAPIAGDNGKIEGAVLVFRDVTERRKADETSRLLASIVESSSDAIITHDLNGSVLSWNRGAERIFGYSAEEMIDGPISRLAAPGHPYEIPEVVERLRRGERIAQYNAIRSTKAGDLIHISVSVSSLCDAEGHLMGISKIARDVTNQVRAAEQLAQLNLDLRQSNERLARSNEDLERFAFVASHDLQEPLRMITMYSQLLVKNYAGVLNEEAARFVANIIVSSRRLRDLLADLLAYAEIGAPAENLVNDVDLNKVLAVVQENLKMAIDDSGARILADRLPTVRAYEGHFVTLFQNLISNAIKYRAERPPHIRLSVAQTDGQVEFALSDNGIGIDPQYHKKIFTAFTRLHGKKIAGTGIGLAICQRVVQRYGGAIWVESQLGEGATFFFTLPSLHNEKEAPREHAVQDSPGGG